MAPGLFSIILISRQQAISGAVYFAFFTFSLYHKNTKNIILSYLSDLTLVSDREGIDNPFITLVARFLFVCVGTRDLRVVSYWIDTLVLKNWGKYLRYFAASPFPLQGKSNTCSRGSKKDLWRRCRRDLCTSQDIPSTHHKLLSLALHYLPFASRFPLPHFTFAVYSTFSIRLPPICIFVCVSMCLPFAGIFACQKSICMNPLKVLYLDHLWSICARA